LWWGACLRHERQGWVVSQPDPLGEPARHQGDLRAAEEPSVSVHGRRSRTRRSLASQATVGYDVDGAVVTVTIDRAEIRNAVDSKTAAALAESFERFDADESLSVAVLTGAGGNFCAGFDLKALAGLGAPAQRDGRGPDGTDA